jgi:prepilin-type N-terminal cleavage/methylation domain-containing protein
MTRFQNPPRSRPGFTLVEILIVIAIIAILVSLISVAAVRALSKGDEIKNRNDIQQLATAVTNFQTNFKVPYVPSRIRLSGPGAYDLSISAGPVPPAGQPNNQLDFDSAQFLQRVWPRIKFIDPTINPPYSPYTGIAWDGTNPLIDVTLQGDQCLVFFLGGIPSAAGCTGFSTYPQNPAILGGERIRPFFDFKPNRLAPRANGFFAYTDPYGVSYAYFSSYKSMNGYNRYGGTDCLFLGVSPYQDSLLTYLNPQSFQIISAGANKFFGVGGPIWTAATADTSVSIGPVVSPTDGRMRGADDMSNFHDLLLGSPK